MKPVYLLLISIVILCCNNKKSIQTFNATGRSIEIKYAEGFNVYTHHNAKRVEVLYPFQGATSGYTYLLVPKGEPVPEHDSDVKIIYTPITSIVCTSTSHIPLLDYINETEKLVGFTSTDYISSSKMRKRVEEGHVQELGIDKGINLELLAVLKPDLVMGYTMSSDYKQFSQIEKLGTPVVINAEYLEKHPLGRAEWIKFMALFFNKEKEADSIFNAIEESYLQVKAIADTITSRPRLISGIVYGDAWFLPGGQNYASKILKDAGCHYLWEDDPSHGFLELSFEGVYEKAHDADLWIGVGSFKTLHEMKIADQRYTRFKPYQQKQVYTYDARVGSKGGSEFMELGYLRPDIILKDLVKISHPRLLPGYELFFHKKLE
jgi:iron complex transport system substrate-binding protein